MMSSHVKWMRSFLDRSNVRASLCAVQLLSAGCGAVHPDFVAAAGYDTTSSAITYMLNQLALNPHVLEQVC